EAFDLPGPILEVGAYQVRGQESIADLRPFFPGKEYTGVDRRPGPGVDVLGDVECLPYPDRSFGTVLALSTFEHVPLFWPVSEAFDLPGPILEVGAYQVRGQESIADLRPFFPGKEYTGVDRRPGPGVDVLGDVECLPYPDRSFGTVLALSTFEHVPHFWRGF